MEAERRVINILVVRSLLAGDVQVWSWMYESEAQEREVRVGDLNLGIISTGQVILIKAINLSEPQFNHL